MAQRKLFNTNLTIPCTMEMWMQTEALSLVLKESKATIVRRAMRRALEQELEKLSPGERQLLDNIYADLKLHPDRIMKG